VGVVNAVLTLGRSRTSNDRWTPSVAWNRYRAPFVLSAVALVLGVVAAPLLDPAVLDDQAGPGLRHRAHAMVFADHAGLVTPGHPLGGR
jgi:hypothetical protein